MAVDWLKIKTEYITTSTSYRKLRDKYGVGVTAICTRAQRERWQEQRERFQNNTVTKTIEAVTNDVVDRNARIIEVADELLYKIEEVVRNTTPERIALWNGQTLRNFTGALKDLKEIQGIKSERDIREQEARIRKLEREALGEERETSVVVEFVNDDDYSK